MEAKKLYKYSIEISLNKNSFWGKILSWFIPELVVPRMNFLKDKVEKGIFKIQTQVVDNPDLTHFCIPKNMTSPIFDAEELLSRIIIADFWESDDGDVYHFIVSRSEVGKLYEVLHSCGMINIMDQNSTVIETKSANTNILKGADFDEKIEPVESKAEPVIPANKSISKSARVQTSNPETQSGITDRNPELG